MTLNAKVKVVMDFLAIFGDFWLRYTFQERIAPKSLEIDRHSLHKKLSALNVICTGLSFVPLCSRNSLYENVKLVYPL